MFRYLVILASILSVSAFAPAGRVSTSTSLKMDYSKELGVQAPLGFFDPLGLLKDADEEKFNHYRYCEIKHGRISMLAVLGHIVTTKGDRFPGEIAYGVPFASIKAGVAAFENIPFAGFLQLFFFIGLAELGFSTVEKDIEEFCMGEAKRYGWDEKKINSKRAIELNNGRAAQMGILGLIVHEKIDNNPYILNSLLGAPIDFNNLPVASY